jgi:hypothetical protein
MAIAWRKEHSSFLGSTLARRAFSSALAFLNLSTATWQGSERRYYGFFKSWAATND